MCNSPRKYLLPRYEKLSPNDRRDIRYKNIGKLLKSIYIELYTIFVRFILNQGNLLKLEIILLESIEF